VTVSIEAMVELRDVLPIRWQATGQALRSLRLVEKRPESADVSSFLLEARDGGPLADFQPGQHLPLEVAIPGREMRVSRSYSLSAAADGQRYRISVKRDPRGLVSRFLHDTLKPGDLLSMLGGLARRGDEREVWFIHQVADRRGCSGGAVAHPGGGFLSLRSTGLRGGIAR